MCFLSLSNFLSNFLIASFLLFGSFSFSQEQEVDSLDQYSFKELNNKFKKIIYQNKGHAKLYAEKILKNATSENNHAEKITALIHLANLKNINREVEQAFIDVDHAISIAKDKFKGEELEAKAIFTKGILYYQNSDYENAFKQYTIAYNFYKNTDNNHMTNSISHNISLIKNTLGDHEGALEILKKNYSNYINATTAKRDKSFSRTFHANTLLALSEAYIKLSNKQLEKKKSLLDSASIYNELGYIETKKINDEAGNIHLNTEKGIISYERKNYERALRELNTSIDRTQKQGYKSLLTFAYYYKALCYQKTQKIDSAVVYFQKTDSISQKNASNYPILQSAYYELVKIYKERKDKANAFKYQELYIENDRINERLTGIVREDIHEKYDLDILNGEIDDLNNVRLKRGFIIGVLAITLLGFFIFHRKQKQKNKIAFEKLMKQLKEEKKSNVIVEKRKKSVTIDDEKVVQVLKALEKFEEKEWFRNKNCDLSFVAKKVKTNKTYLSKIIHTHKQLKFIDYIRNLRIDYALKRLKDDSVFRSYDIKSIAEESGFKSSDMFSRAFVKNTGIYPSYYIKKINKIKP